MALPVPLRMLALPLMVEVAASIGAMILAAAHAMGADPAVLAKRAGFDAACANDPDARIPIGVVGHAIKTVLTS